MVILGGLVQQVGTALFIGGFALYLGTILYRMARIFGLQAFQREAFLVGFYARAAGMVGIIGAMTGGIIEGTIPWPWLLAVFVLGAPSLALLVVRPVRGEPFTVEFPPRNKP
jgi:MFS family permease